MAQGVTGGRMQLMNTRFLPFFFCTRQSPVSKRPVSSAWYSPITAPESASTMETTEDRLFSLETVACLGTCFLAPVVMIDHDYFGSVTADKVPEILEDYR